MSASTTISMRNEGLCQLESNENQRISVACPQARGATSLVELRYLRAGSGQSLGRLLLWEKLWRVRLAPERGLGGCLRPARSIKRAFALEEVFADWGEDIDQGTCFQASAALHHVWILVQAIARTDFVMVIYDGEEEAP